MRRDQNGIEGANEKQVSVQQRQESWKERKAKEKGMWTVLGGVWAATPLALCRWV